jgi:hypothetical protein
VSVPAHLEAGGIIWALIAEIHQSWASLELTLNQSFYRR